MNGRRTKKGPSRRVNLVLLKMMIPKGACSILVRWPAGTGAPARWRVRRGARRGVVVVVVV